MYIEIFSVVLCIVMVFNFEYFILREDPVKNIFFYPLHIPVFPIP